MNSQKGSSYPFPAALCKTVLRGRGATCGSQGRAALACLLACVPSSTADSQRVGGRSPNATISFPALTACRGQVVQRYQVVQGSISNSRTALRHSCWQHTACTSRVDLRQCHHIYCRWPAPGCLGRSRNIHLLATRTKCRGGRTGCPSLACNFWMYQAKAWRNSGRSMRSLYVIN